MINALVINICRYMDVVHDNSLKDYIPIVFSQLSVLDLFSFLHFSTCVVALGTSTLAVLGILANPCLQVAKPNQCGSVDHSFVQH